GRIKTIIETKSEGGYFLLPGSPAACHEKRRPYEITQGRFDRIPELTSEQRNVFLALPRTFDEIQPEPYEPKRTPQQRNGPGTLLPGEDFNQRGPSFETLLVGWQKWKTLSQKTWWTRPGKTKGVSASTNERYFYPFTTNSEFDPLRAYSKFAVYTILNHSGDFSAAAKALYQEGYGSRAETRSESRDAPISEPGREKS